MAGRFFCEYCSVFIPIANRTEHNASHDYFSSDSCQSCARVFNRDPRRHRDRKERNWAEKNEATPRKAKSGKPLCAKTHEHILRLIAKFVPRHCPVCEKSFPVPYTVLKPGTQKLLKKLSRYPIKGGKIFGLLDPTEKKPAVAKYADQCKHVKVSTMYMAATAFFYCDSEWVIDMIEEYQELTGDSMRDEIIAYSSPAFSRGLLRLLGLPKPQPFQPPLQKTLPHFAETAIALPQVITSRTKMLNPMVLNQASKAEEESADAEVDWGLSVDISEVNAHSIANFGMTSYNGVYYRTLPEDAVFEVPVNRGIPVRRFFGEITHSQLTDWYTKFYLVGNEVYNRPTFGVGVVQPLPTYRFNTYPVPLDVTSVVANRGKYEQLLCIRSHQVGGLRFQTLYHLLEYPKPEVLRDIADAIKGKTVRV